MNGLKDGVSNEWFATFDLATPAAARGQKPSVVIDRPVLQQILLDQVGGCLTLTLIPPPPLLTSTSTTPHLHFHLHLHHASPPPNLHLRPCTTSTSTSTSTSDSTSTCTSHLHQVGDCLTMGQEVVGCERSESGAVKGVLADGTKQEADLLVGSDGLRSKIRSRLRLPP